MSADSRLERVITTNLDDIADELRAFEALAAQELRFSVFHLQQAAEKLVRVVRIHRGLVVTKDHDITLLIDGRASGEPRPLPAGDPWRARLLDHEWLTQYATAFRYTSDAGHRKSAPPKAKLLETHAALVALLALARAELV